MAASAPGMMSVIDGSVVPGRSAPGMSSVMTRSLTAGPHQPSQAVNELDGLVQGILPADTRKVMSSGYEVPV